MKNEEYFCRYHIYCEKNYFIRNQICERYVIYNDLYCMTNTFLKINFNFVAIDGINLRLTVIVSRSSLILIIH